MASRPAQFRINRNAPLAKGLVFAGMGGLNCSGTTLFADSSGYGNDATLIASDAATGWVWNSSLARHGVNLAGPDRIDRIGRPAIGAARFTAAIWGIPNSPAAYRSIIAERALGPKYANTWQILPNGRRRYYVALRNSANVSFATGLSAAVSNGVPTHFAFSFDGLTGILYINGSVATSLEITGSYTGSAQPLLISGNWDGQTWRGVVCDAMYWGRVLSPLEISALADPSNVMLSGLIVPRATRRVFWYTEGGGDIIVPRQIFSKRKASIYRR